MSINSKIFWIVVVVGLLGWELFPPSEKLKPGIDLAGGTSLIYQINMEGLTTREKENVGPSMIAILRKRVDPTNKANMVWRLHGLDRIEIQMPHPAPDILAWRTTFYDLIKDIEAESISTRVVQNAVKLNGVARDVAFKEIANGDKGVADLLLAYSASVDAHKTTQLALGEVLKEIAQLKKNLMGDDIKLRNINSVDSLAQRYKGLDDPNKDKELDQLVAQVDKEKQADAKQFVKAYVINRIDLTAQRNARDEASEHKNNSWDDISALNINRDRLMLLLQSNSKSAQQSINNIKLDRPAIADLLTSADKAWAEYSRGASALDDPEELKSKLQGSGVLEFRIMVSPQDARDVDKYRSKLQKHGPGGTGRSIWDKEDYLWVAVKDEVRGELVFGEFAGIRYALGSNIKSEILLNEKGDGSWKLTRASATTDSLNKPAISFDFNEAGRTRFLTLTKANLEKALGILLDGTLYSAPNLNSAINGSGLITGSFSFKEANNLADTLKAGSLPARLSRLPISENTVGPTVGAENLKSGLKAGQYGLALVLVFMAIYYMIPGVFAAIALALNMVIILGIMAFTEATFTLPGIAGMILTIGMAVDANVLIFERIREEQKRGSSLLMAVQNGYDRAFTTILDANITTFIPAFILFKISSEEVKGFTITLMIGLATSMFTSLFVTRTLFDWCIKKKIITDVVNMNEMIHGWKVSWIGLRPKFWMLSLVLVVGSWFIFITKINSNESLFSTELTGGTSVIVNLNSNGAELNRQKIQDLLAAESLMANVQQVGGNDSNQYGITTTVTNSLDAKLEVFEGSQTVESLLRLAQNATDKRVNGSEIKATDNANVFLIHTDQVNINKINAVFSSAKARVINGSDAINEVVGDAIRTALAGKLNTQESLSPPLADSIKATLIDAEFIQKKDYLSNVMGDVLFEVPFGDNKTETLKHLRIRFSNARDKNDLQAFGTNSQTLFSSNNFTADVTIALDNIEVVVTPTIMLEDASATVLASFIKNESERIVEILKIKTALPRMSQIDPSVGAKSQQSAIVAIVISLIGIILYVWIRFGTIRFGIAAVIAVMHDVSIALGMVALSGSLIGILGIREFKIDLPMIAAFLTVIGYSLNDTIVVFDRIRENRGKVTRKLGAATINKSINQTVSRTALTSATTLIVLVIMYAFGGAGLRGFNYVLIIGVLVGTYSSVAIASPLLLGVTEKIVEDEETEDDLVGP
jgi:SecD/SecF fusion protein